MRLGLISDETGHRHPRDLFEYGLSRGIRTFELRSLYGKRVPDLEEEERAELQRLIREMGVAISAVSPGLFKCALDDPAMEEHTGALLARSLDFAQRLEVGKLIVFGVRRRARDRPGDRERVLHILGEAAHAAGRRGVTLCMENEPGWWADTPEHVLDILQSLESAGLWLNWDPGNLFAAGVHDCGPGYERLKRYIRHIHVKDALQAPDGSCRYVPLGRGCIRWDQQLADLARDGYGGDISIETHCEPLLPNTDSNIAYIRRLLPA